MSVLLSPGRWDSARRVLERLEQRGLLLDGVAASPAELGEVDHPVEGGRELDEARHVANQD